MVYISVSFGKDPSFDARYPNRSTIEIVVPCPWEWVEQWADKPWGKRGAGLRCAKRRLFAAFARKLYQNYRICVPN